MLDGLSLLHLCLTLLLLLNHLTKLFDGLAKLLEVLRVSIDLLPASRVGRKPLQVILDVLTDALHEQHDFFGIATTLER